VRIVLEYARREISHGLGVIVLATEMLLVKRAKLYTNPCTGTELDLAIGRVIVRSTAA